MTFKIDGTTIVEELGKVLVDGTQATEVRIDGTTVWKPDPPPPPTDLDCNFEIRVDPEFGFYVGFIEGEGGMGDLTPSYLEWPDGIQDTGYPIPNKGFTFTDLYMLYDASGSPGWTFSFFKLDATHNEAGNPLASRGPAELTDNWLLQITFDNGTKTATAVGEQIIYLPPWGYNSIPLSDWIYNSRNTTQAISFTWIPR